MSYKTLVGFDFLYIGWVLGKNTCPFWDMWHDKSQKTIFIYLGKLRIELSYG